MKTTTDSHYPKPEQFCPSTVQKSDNKQSPRTVKNPPRSSSKMSEIETDAATIDAIPHLVFDSTSYEEIPKFLSGEIAEPASEAVP